MRTTLRFDPRGGIQCLYTDRIDLRVLGRLQVVRASKVDFVPEEQLWTVRCAASGKLIFSDPSRETCLAWEQDNLQPGTSVPIQPNLRSTMKKVILAITITLAVLLAAVGFNHSKLRGELRAIDAELDQIRIVAEHHRAQMSQAEFDGLIGSFAVGYGAVAGDYQLAGDGAGTAFNSAIQYDVSSTFLEQLQQRYDQLVNRRAQIVEKLE